MKKSILNLGAQELTKNEQKEVNGGKPVMPINCYCDNGIYLGVFSTSQECKQAKINQCAV